MKTKKSVDAEKLDGEKSVNLSRGGKKKSLLPNLGHVKKPATKKTVSQPLDIDSICTYHLVQITLEKVEKLLKQLSSTPPRHKMKKRLPVGKHTIRKPIDTQSTVGERVVSSTQMKSETVIQQDLNEVSTPQTPVMKYRWVAEVREGAPGFADDDKCSGEWFITKESAEEDMNNNAEKKCKRFFPYLRWITNMYIEEKNILS